MSGAPVPGLAALAAARDLPDGPAKIAELERIAAYADATGEVRLGVDARLDLIETYRHHGERWRSAEPLHRCLAAVDDSPGLFDADDLDLLHRYQRHAVEALTGSPRIGLDQARATLDDLTRRLAGAEPGVVAELRCRLADHVGDEPTAREWFARWGAAGPGRDCPACVAVRRADLLTGWGEWTAALRELEPVFADPGDCTDQPERALAAALLPYLRLGRHEEAGRAHVRAYRRHRRERDGVAALPAHLRFCALAGHPDRGLEILLDQLPRLRQPTDEMSAMECATAGALLCRLITEAGPTQPPAGPGTPRPPGPDGPVDVAALGAALLATATDLAGRFDARNGTGHQSGRVAARLAERPLTTTPTPLPAGPVPVDDPADGDAGEEPTDPAPATGEAAPGEPAPLTVAMLVAVLERRGDRCTVDPAGAVVGRWGEAVVRFERVGAAGDVLHARVVATRRLPAGRRAEAYEFCNAWNRDRLLPKAYVHELESGELVLAGDVTTDLGPGIAPVQVAVLVDATVTTGAAYAAAVAALP